MAGARLRKLVLRGCSGVTSTGLTKVATKCRLLAELSVSDCLQITDHDVLLLCQVRPRGLVQFGLGPYLPTLRNVSSIGVFGVLPPVRRSWNGSK